MGRYRQGLRSWRRTNRLRFAAISLPFIAAGIAVGIRSDDQIAWAAGMITGGFMALWMAFREMPPAYVEHWREGAEGEVRTAKILTRFERAGWCVAHDVQRSSGTSNHRRHRGNYDHIAVGRSGIYLLETKNLQGIVEIHNGAPRVTRRHDPEKKETWENIPRAALSCAAELGEEIERLTGDRPWVQAIVVFWSDFPQGLVREGRCVFIHGNRLRAWLESQVDQFSESRFEEIAGGVRAIARGSAVEPIAGVAEPTPA